MSDSDEPVEYFPGSLVVLRQCCNCFKQQEDNVQLKRCAGCASALYCSQKCQKDAWLQHKEMCKYLAQRVRENGDKDQLDNDARLLEPKAATEFSDALNGYINTNYWALCIYAKAQALLEGGFRDGGIKFTQNPPKVLVVNLLPLPGGLAVPPGHAFKWLGHGWKTVEQYKNSSKVNLQNWNRSLSTQRSMRERISGSPLFAGLLPVQFEILGANFSMLSFLPQRHPDSLIMEADLFDVEAMRIVINDAVWLSEGSMNAEMAFRLVDLNNTRVALPGKWVQCGTQSWMWGPAFPDWEGFLEGRYNPPGFDSVKLKRVLSRLKSKVSMFQLLMMIEAL